MHWIPSPFPFAKSLALLILLASLAGSGQAAMITVNSPLDVDNPDAVLTLREALLIANGSREPFDNPIPDEPDEQAQVFGNYGAGVNDTIQLALGMNATITLAAHLPDLSDPGDALHGGQATLDAGALSVVAKSGVFFLDQSNQVISGFNIINFEGSGVIVSGSGYQISSIVISMCGGTGMVLSGATNNTIHDVIISHGLSHGLVVQDGAKGNTLYNFHVYGNAISGIVFRDANTEFNTLYKANVGLTEPPGNVVVGNDGWGIELIGGAKNNRIGDPAADSSFSYIAGNGLGGLLVSDAGTSGNLLHSMFIGARSTGPFTIEKVGNGSGPGILVQASATNNNIGKGGQNAAILVAGHQTDGIVVDGPGTTGNDFFRIYIGENPFNGTGDLGNTGHGFLVRNGASHFRIGGTDEMFSQIEVEDTGPDKHAFFLDGAGAPISNIVFGAYHLGDYAAIKGSVSIGGNGILMTGDVSNVMVGNPGHRNTTCGARDFGIVLDGADVHDITLIHVFAGQGTNGQAPNGLGGLLIKNGAHNIQTSGVDPSEFSWFAGNNGPGIIIDCRDAMIPHDITVANTIIGLDFFSGMALPNVTAGIFIPGAAGGDQTRTENIVIGPDSVISGNNGPGIRLENVADIAIQGNKIGVNMAGTAAAGNQEDGILIDNCRELTIGSRVQDNLGNVISGNMMAGVHFTNQSRFIALNRNIIGLSADGNAAIGNQEAGVKVSPPGPPGDFDALIIGGASELADPFGPAADRGEGNVISGNAIGVLVTAPGMMGAGAGEGPAPGDIVRNVQIEGNLIGTAPDGSTPLGNNVGVRIEGANVTSAIVGRLNNDQRGNIISGNVGDGIQIEGANGWRIYRNAVGTDRQRGAAIGNGGHGIAISQTSNGRIGTDDPAGAMNVISGNAKAGIHISDNAHGDILIRNNHIGTNLNGLMAIPNQDGILIEPGIGEGGEQLYIGGANSSIANEIGGSIRQGNLISGNTRNGIRVAAPGGMGSPSIFGLHLEGNIIGSNLLGTAALANDGDGIHITGGAVEEVHIGEAGVSAKANLISGNGGHGVFIGDRAEFVRLHHNRIGCKPDPEERMPNMMSGVRIEADSQRCLLENNIIRFNEKFGIHTDGAQTNRNRFSNNSIHLNKEFGIRVEGNSQNAIKPPHLNQLHTVNFNKNSILGTTIPNGRVEVFVDPIVTTPADTGYWGQGKKRVMTLTADGEGKFTINAGAINDTGIVTCTVRDEMDNTSEFSAFLDGYVVQSDQDDSAYLVAGKRTVVRVFGNLSVKEGSRQVTGVLVMDGGAQSLAPMPANYSMRRYGGWDGSAFARRKGEDSLVFYINAPSAGSHSFEFKLMSRNVERGKINLGSFLFQQTTPFSLAAIPVTAPPRAGGNPTQSPNGPSMQQAAQFVEAVYPFADGALMANFRVLPGIIIDFLPHNTSFLDGRQRRMMNMVEEQRAKARLANGKPPTYAAGVVSRLTAFNPPGSEGMTYGFHYCHGLPWVVATLDQRTRFGGFIHNGPTYAHEIGHAAPFNLGDTYEGGSNKERNPRNTDANRVNSSGNVTLEDAVAFSPTGAYQYNLFSMPGPVWISSSNTTSGVGGVDFMGNGTYRWVDAATWRILFSEMGGTVSGAGAAVNVAESVNPAIIVTGEISGDDSASISPLEFFGGELDRLMPPADAGTIYSVELQDGSGMALDSQTFGLDFEIEEFTTDDMGNETGGYSAVDAQVFSVVLRDDAAGEAVVLKKGGTVLVTVEKSENDPTIDYTGPNGPGTLPSGDVTIRWTANDADAGDEVSVDVFYTPDGTIMLPLAANLTGVSEAIVNTDALPAGPAARFVVRASDGWRTAEDQSDPPFAVDDRTPSISITLPETGGDLRENLAIQLAAMAYDPEDGVLMGDAIEWSLDGSLVPIATGMQPVVMIEKGAHTLRATATDSMTNSAFHEIDITVERVIAYSLDIVDFILERGDEPPGADVNEDGDINLSDVIEAVKREEMLAAQDQ